jgi:argininosuccinate lyase
LEPAILSSPSRSGAFDSTIDRRVEEFTESISFDFRLYQQDITASLAHAEMLRSQGLLSEDEFLQIEKCLSEVRAEIERGDFKFHRSLEDIHMNIEAALIERLGDVGRKLHTGRSRNDQISTDLRLWIREQIQKIDYLLVDLQRAFLGIAEREFDVIIPAYTHLQRAQPVLAAHYILSFCEKFERDRQRLSDVRSRVNLCSLGTAALAGTTIPIDRGQVAEKLGFGGVVQNSLDSSSDRDFALEFAFGLAMIALHLSSWAEDWILWSTAEFDFIRVPHERDR